MSIINRDNAIDNDIVTRIQLVQKYGLASSDRIQFALELLQSADRTIKTAANEIEKQKGIMFQAQAQKLIIAQRFANDLHEYKQKVIDNSAATSEGIDESTMAKMEGFADMTKNANDDLQDRGTPIQDEKTSEPPTKKSQKTKSR